MADREGKPTNNDIRETVKEHQRENEGGADSNKQFRAAEHQAHNDAQKSGEDLPNRDLSTKEDVPSKRSND